MSRETKDLFWYLLTPSIQGAASIAMIPWLLRLTTKEQFGEITTSILVAQLISVLMGFGMTTAITRSWFDSKLGLPSHLISLTYYMILASLIIGMVIIFFASLYSHSLDLAIIVIVLFIATGMSIRDLALANLRANTNSRAFFFLSLFSNTVTTLVGCLYLLYFSGSKAAKIYLFGVLITYMLIIVWTLVQYPPSNFSRNTARQGLAISLPLVPHSLGILLITLIDRLLIQIQLGDKAVGEYQAAYLWGNLGIVFIAAANNFLSIIIYRIASPARKLFVVLTAKASLIIAFGIELAITSIAPYINQALVPKKYDGILITSIIQISSAATVCYTGYLLGANAIFARSKTFAFAFISPLILILGLPMMIWGTRSYGIVGTAFFSVFSYFLLGLVTLTIALKKNLIEKSTIYYYLCLIVLSSILQYQFFYNGHLSNIYIGIRGLFLLLGFILIVLQTIKIRSLIQGE